MASEMGTPALAILVMTVTRVQWKQRCGIPVSLKKVCHIA